MTDYFNRKTQPVLKNHGVVAYTPSRLPGIFSFVLTGALFIAALLLAFGQAFADRDALPYVMADAIKPIKPQMAHGADQRTEPLPRP
jgi:hypothetical protein